MIIQTFEHDYPVSSVKEMNNVYDCYICGNANGGGFCQILAIKDKSRFADLMSWLTLTVNTATFTDYIEHFNFDDKLCIVMKHTQGISLRKKLMTESLSLSERLELGRKILERVVLQEIPEYFLAKCFNLDCIIVNSDLSVNFNYPIGDIMGDRSKEASDEIEAVLRALFVTELEKKIPNALVEFFDKIDELLDYNIIELYSVYYLMMSKVEAVETEAEEPKSIWYKIWDKTKKVLAVLKNILMITLVVLAVIYLLETINGTKSSTTMTSNFDTIGTVEIEKNG